MIYKSIFGTALIGILGLMLAAGGCASNGNGDSGAAASAGDGMMCPKCETVWVRNDKKMGPKYDRLTWAEKKMVCPDCDATAKAYFENGEKVLHNCPTCNVTPETLTPSNATHPKGPHS